MRTVVVACGDSPSLALGLEPENRIEYLCKDPGQLTGFEDADRLVLVLHGGRYHLPDVQRAAREIGVDPLGVQILEVDDDSGGAMARPEVLGLAARATAFEESHPEHSKPVIPTEVTRRGFLHPLAPSYVGAPMIDHQACAASDGCKACVDICPEGAYEWRDGQVIYDLDTCIPCGRCVTACPTGAIGNPTATPPMVEAQVRALVAGADDGVGIRFVCSRGSVERRAGWTDVTVPCSSMVPASWVLACLLLGATGARVVPCEDSGCPLDLGHWATLANDVAHSTLESAGLDGTLVTGDILGGVLGRVPIVDPFGPQGSPAVIDALASIAPQAIDLAHPAANLGIVEIEPSACTLCGQCAKICPTGALLEVYDGDEVSIEFDARRCVNCSQCLSMCPEIERGAITVAGKYDSAELANGPRVLNRGQVVTCENCGEAFAPASMMDRIAGLLGPEFDGTMSVVGRRCLDCRGR